MDEYGDEAVQSLHFFYDAQSRPVFVEYNGMKYRYIHNLQGDIVGIVDGNGNLVVEYKYDAWGKPIAITGTLKTSLGALNPFRYRGYIYDEETELYWLKSRYYSSRQYRFISIDYLLGKRGSVVEHNVYAYSKNSPIMLADDNGDSPYSATKALEYAKKWYNKRNPEFSYKGMGSDCANFVSQCLFAGGCQEPKNGFIGV